MEKLHPVQLSNWIKHPVTKALLIALSKESVVHKDKVSSVGTTVGWMQAPHIDRELAFESGVIQTLEILLNKEDLKNFLMRYEMLEEISND